jgi:hypothetical protein
MKAMEGRRTPEAQSSSHISSGQRNEALIFLGRLPRFPPNIHQEAAAQ